MEAAMAHTCMGPPGAPSRETATAPDKTCKWSGRSPKRARQTETASRTMLDSDGRGVRVSVSRAGPRASSSSHACRNRRRPARVLPLRALRAVVHVDRLSVHHHGLEPGRQRTRVVPLSLHGENQESAAAKDDEALTVCVAWCTKTTRPEGSVNASQPSGSGADCRTSIMVS